VGQRGPPRGAQVGEQILLQDLFAGRIVVRARPAPGVVMGDEHDAVVALARDGEEVVPARGAHGPRGQALSLDHDLLPEFRAEPARAVCSTPVGWASRGRWVTPRASGWWWVRSCSSGCASRTGSGPPRTFWWRCC